MYGILIYDLLYLPFVVSHILKKGNFLKIQQAKLFEKDLPLLINLYTFEIGFLLSWKGYYTILKLIKEQ